jgi:branched-chain amino acid transport system substrate-binding protein
MLVKIHVIAAASVALLAGAASAQDMVVKIGHVGPVSGAQAHYGKDNENGARMAIDDLNAKGVTIGGKCYHFKIKYYDD